jgi:hypothetical protein
LTGKSGSSRDARVSDGMTRPDLERILYRGHPAVGTLRAAYQFALLAASGEFKGLLVVEAENEWAVASIEKLLMRDGYVSPSCRILMVFRDHRSAGVRDDVVKEVRFLDFMVDYVDSDRLVQADALECFSRSLSAEDRAAAKERISRRASRPVQAIVPPPHRPAPPNPFHQKDGVNAFTEIFPNPFPSGPDEFA